MFFNWYFDIYSSISAIKYSLPETSEAIQNGTVYSEAIQNGTVYLFHVSGFFSYPLKTPENLCFSEISGIKWVNCQQLVA